MLSQEGFSTHRVAILSGDGRGGFSRTREVPVPFSVRVATGDVNGDGRPDLLVDNAGAGLSHIWVILSSCYAEADLRVAQSIAPEPAIRGQSLTLAVTVTNSGPNPAAGVTVTEALQGGAAVLSASASQEICSYSQLVTCRFGTINYGESVTIQIVARALSAGAATSTAEVTSNTPDPQRANNSVSEVIRINNPLPQITRLSPSAVPAAGAGISLRVSGRNFVRGATLTWNGQNQRTIFVSDTMLRLAPSARHLAIPGTASIAVTNPAPGGGLSNTISFIILPP